MQLPIKILCINIILAIAVAFFLTLGFHIDRLEDFFFVFGLTGLIGGILELFIGLFLLMNEDKRYAQGFLLSGGVLMLLGFLSCSTLLVKI